MRKEFLGRLAAVVAAVTLLVSASAWRSALVELEETKRQLAYCRTWVANDTAALDEAARLLSEVKANCACPHPPERLP